jgi:hypothetical protein
MVLKTQVIGEQYKCPKKDMAGSYKTRWNLDVKELPYLTRS